MALVERLMHDGSEPIERWIRTHEFFAFMLELARGGIQKPFIVNHYQLSPAEEAELDILINLTPWSMPGRLFMSEIVHSMFLLTQFDSNYGATSGYDTPTSIRDKISNITFPTLVPNNYLIAPTNNVWNNMPTALTEVFGNQFRRVQINLSNADAVRLTANITTQGAINAVLFAQYSLDQSNWNVLTSNLNLNPIGFKTTSWEAIPSGARGDVYVRMVGQNGDGTADPVICQLAIQVR